MNTDPGPIDVDVDVPEPESSDANLDPARDADDIQGSASGADIDSDPALADDHTGSIGDHLELDSDPSQESIVQVGWVDLDRDPSLDITDEGLPVDSDTSASTPIDAANLHDLHQDLDPAASITEESEFILFGQADFALASLALPEGQVSESINPRDKHEEHSDEAGGQAISGSEKNERDRVANPKYGIGFRFGSAEVIQEQIDRFWNSLTDAQIELLKNPATHVIFHGHASRPGSKDVNDLLADARAEGFADALIAKGARASFETIGHGEEWAYKVGWRESMDKSDFRVALIAIDPPVTETFNFEGDADTVEGRQLFTRWENFQVDAKAGKSIYQGLLDEVLESVSGEASLAENPVAIEKLAVSVGKDIASGRWWVAVAKTGGAMVVGGIVDALTGTQSKEVWAVRLECYEAWAKGIASELDAEAKYDLDLMNARERKYFEQGRDSVSGLSQLEKYQLQLALINNGRLSDFNQHKPSTGYFESRWNGSGILDGAAGSAYGYWKRRYRH